MSDDDLSRRAKEIREKAERVRDAASDPDAGQSLGEKANAKVSRLKKILSPFVATVAWLFRLIRRWANWVAYIPPAGPGDEPRFSKVRLVRNLALTAISPILLHMTFKAIYFYTTYFDETVYVTGKQEIETGELYQFGGCTSLPCKTESDNGKFYLIESSLYFPVLFYPEEDVFANIPQQDGACHVEGYGIYFRSLRWIYKTFQLYQHVVDVSCRPYTVDEIREAVDDGDIVKDVDRNDPDR